MSDTVQRDKVAALAKTDPGQALTIARAIADPWFRAQALSHFVRYSLTDPCAIAAEAEDQTAASRFAETLTAEAVRNKCLARLTAGGTTPRPFFW